MGAQVIAICDQNDKETAALADVAFPIVGALTDEFSPLTCVVPGEQFAAYLCVALNRSAFEFISPRQYKVNIRQVGSSRIVLGE